jgi:hypothetical protein
MLHAFNARLGSLLDECRTNEFFIGAPDPQFIISQVMNVHNQETISKFETKYGLDFSSLFPFPDQDKIREFIRANKSFAEFLLGYNGNFISNEYTIDPKTHELVPKDDNIYSDDNTQLEFSDSKYHFIKKDTISDTAYYYSHLFEHIIDEQKIVEASAHEGNPVTLYSSVHTAWSEHFFPALIDHVYLLHGDPTHNSVKMCILPSFHRALETLCREFDDLDSAIVAAYRMLPKKEKRTTEIIHLLTDRSLPYVLDDDTGELRTMVNSGYYIAFQKPGKANIYIQMNIVAIGSDQFGAKINNHVEKLDCIDMRHMCEVIDNIIENDVKTEWVDKLQHISIPNFIVKLEAGDRFFSAKMQISASTYILVRFTFDTRQWCKCKVVKNGVIPTTSWTLIRSQKYFFNKYVKFVKTQDTDPSQH